MGAAYSVNTSTMFVMKDGIKMNELLIEGENIDIDMWESAEGGMVIDICDDSVEMVTIVSVDNLIRMRDLINKIIG